ncbi:MAG TPA: preprotein translocase subunit YajC [Gammaproteobacteria bacterium]|nr:preprotein translocase subunit YajC [Gammaproteobacteria bacterium]
MNFFISNAWAQDAPAAAPPEPGLMGFVPLIIIFVLFYFLLIRPQMKRAKEHRKMVEALSKGDEVVSNGGLLGRITAVDDNFVTMEVADGVRVKIQRNMIASVMPRGTVKSIGKEGGKGKGKAKGKEAPAAEETPALEEKKQEEK